MKWKGLLFLFFGPPVLGGEHFQLGEKVHSADLVVEVYVTVHGDIPSHWPNTAYDPQGWAFPEGLVHKSQAEQRRVFRRPGVEVGPLPSPSQAFLFSRSSRCWWTAHARGGLRALVFLNAEGNPVPFGVEHEWGRYTDLNPDYEEVVEAVKWSLEYRESLEPIKATLQTTESPYLLTVAAKALHNLEGMAAVTAALGGEDSARFKAAHRPPSEPAICR